MSFHSFGPIIPNNEGIDTITEILATILKLVIGRGGFKPIAQGYFKYTHQFANADNVSFSVADFREIGKQMTYYTLADASKGVGEFMKFERGKEWREVSFELEVGKGGYVGSGHLTRSPGTEASVDR
ncbi:hypothetical protein OEA41_001945 [Lepraria neglecta]|uniref:Uncharacterized protein n=1 Tax=Lepraria neglecta TaxID=209136 RepID=A0AAD9ZAZ7_9LECA|nr:hypothetical protein OEA41_001945 [Lepraria neglecta]